MALFISLKNCLNLKGKHDRIAKITFRDESKYTSIYEDSSDAEWDEDIEFTLETPITNKDLIEITIMNHSKYLANRFIYLGNCYLNIIINVIIIHNRPVGSLVISLNCIANENRITISENLVDNKKNILKAVINFILIHVPFSSMNEETNEGSKTLNDFDPKTLKKNNKNNKSDDLNLFQILKKNNNAAKFFQHGDLQYNKQEHTPRDLQNFSLINYNWDSENDLIGKKWKLTLENNKQNDYQVHIRIIEARKLIGLQLDPYVIIQIGSQRKITQVKEQTSNPYWDTTFVIDIKSTFNEVVDKIIFFYVFTGKTIVSQGTIIGMFKLDIGTVFNQPDKRFIRKWAVLTDPDEVFGSSGSSIKGYLKMDLMIIGKDDLIKELPAVKDNEEDIDECLLLPYGISSDRNKAKITIKIYKASGLPRTNSSLISNVKRVITGDINTQLNPYVEVTFAGHKASTSIKRASYEPEWNEQIIFCDLFPPLCRRIKIQLKDSDSVYDDIVGTHYIDLSQISNDGANVNKYKKDCGFLPTYGPTWINLYGSNKGSVFDNGHQLNEGLFEGFSYRGRILIGISCEFGELIGDTSLQRTICISPTESISENAPGNQEDFLAFSLISEVLYLDRKFSDKNIQFELSIANYGGSSNQTFSMDPQISEPITVSAIQNYTTPLIKSKFLDKYFGCVNIDRIKPCLNVKFSWPDNKQRIYNMNVLKKISEEFLDSLERVSIKVKLGHDDSCIHLKKSMEILINNCKNYSLYINQKLHVHYYGKNNLDIERFKLIESELNDISESARNLSENLMNNLQLKHQLKSAYDLFKRIHILVQDPQISFPDLFLWLIVNGKKTAFCRIKQNDIFYSQNPSERGTDCGLLQNISFKLPIKPSESSKSWNLPVLIRGFFWLGLFKHKKFLMDNLDITLNQSIDLHNPAASLPSFVTLNNMSIFIMRSHIYQARSLIGSDASGLSDPFAVIVLNEISNESRIIWQTLSPTWNQMMVSKKLIFFSSSKAISLNPPIVIIEIYDKDLRGSNEFIGRAFAFPVVKINSELYEPPKFPPKLEWIDLRKGCDNAGELLASFELLEVQEISGELSNNEHIPQGDIVESIDGSHYSIPSEIRPVMIKFRIEILFWGVRELKKLNLTSVDRPKVDIECAGMIIESKIISNVRKNPNFPEPYSFFDMDLPENERYCPPLVIQVRDCRAFGRMVLVGTHQVECLTKYVQDDMNYSKITKKRPKNSQELIYVGEEESTNKLVTLIDKNKLKENERENENGSKLKLPIRKTNVASIGENSIKQVESLDWWSRYYETIKFTNKTINEPNQLEKDVQNEAINKIPKIKILNVELENFPLYNGLNDLLATFKLYRGKYNEEEDDDSRIVGTFKGSIRLWKNFDVSSSNFNSMIGTFSRLPTNESFNVLVRIYIIKAINLHPCDMNGKADPYLVISLGKNKIKDRDNYKEKQLNPIFGRVFDVEATIPMNNILTVSVYDYDLVGRDDLIGETKIDIEDRLFSKYRPFCGISEVYSTWGYNKWRDPQKPSQILARLCKEETLDGPYYSPGKCRIENIVFVSASFITEENGITKASDEPAALKALHNFYMLVKDYYIVPEHIETRSLYHPDKIGIQGQLEMWVDIFSMDLPAPGPAIDISPRKPIGYELRVIIWNTEDILLDDKDQLTGEKSSDIFVKGWIEGLKDEEMQTDIHYRSLTGEGNFNWRFLFKFQYEKSEEKIIIKKKSSLISWDENEEKVPPRLILQVWDFDTFSSDDFIGSLEINLTRFIRGTKTSKLCSLEYFKNEKTINLFKQKQIKGWWPFKSTDENNQTTLVGKVEAELELVLQETAEINPVGKGREDPHALAQPNRPHVSIFYRINPINIFMAHIWIPYGFIIKRIFSMLALCVLALFALQTIPGYTVKKIFGA